MMEVDPEVEELHCLMREFPVGAKLNHDGAKLWVMGYYGHDQLLLADRDPCINYNEAVKSCWAYDAHVFRTKH